jgi:hypothetical protein
VTSDLGSPARRPHPPSPQYLSTVDVLTIGYALSYNIWLKLAISNSIDMVAEMFHVDISLGIDLSAIIISLDNT